MNLVSKEKYLLHTKFETARTILAFLCREKLNEVAELFIKTCPYLEFERNAIEEGYAPFNFAYQPISEILHDYSQMGRKLSQLVQRYGCNLSFQRSMTDLEKIECLLELQSNRNTFVQDGTVPSGEEATGVPPATVGQTLTANQEMFSQLSEGGTYKENETVSFMIIPDYGGGGTGVTEYTQGATVSTTDNYTMSTASSAPGFSETAAAMPNEGSGEPVPTQYVLYDGNGNDQQIMIEIIPQENNGLGAPAVATPASQTTSSNASFQAAQCPTNSYSVPAIQNEQEIHPLQHNTSVGVAPSVQTNSNTANDGQYQLLVAGNNQPMMVPAPQVQQEQGQIQTMDTVEHATTVCGAGGIDPQSACHGTVAQQAHLNDTARAVTAKKPARQLPPQSTVTVTTTINQQQVVTRLQDIRRSLSIARQQSQLADTVCSPTPQKAPRRIAHVPKCQPRTIASKALPSSAIKKSNAQKPEAQPVPDATVGNQQPPSSGNGAVSIEPDSAIDPTACALEEWKRIRAINRSNFDNVVRQEISKDIDQQDHKKSIQMRERRKAAMRLAKLRKKMVNTVPPEPQASEPKASVDQPAQQSSTKPVARKTKQRAVSLTAKRASNAPAGQSVNQNATKPPTRKRRQGAVSVTAKRIKRSSVETLANPNDSLEKNAALLEAALYTPMKSDTDQPQQQQQQPIELNRKKLGPTGVLSQSVSLTLTPAKQMPQETVTSGLESQIDSLPQQVAHQPVQPEQVAQPVDRALAPDTPVTKPSSAMKENIDDARAEPQPTPSITMETAAEKGNSIESPFKSSPPATQAETKESPTTKTSVAVTQNETAQAVASITAPTVTPVKVKIVPIPRKQLSYRKRSVSSDSSSSGSSGSDSECNSSSSSSNSSTTMEEDEDIRQMYANTKRYRDGKRVQQPSARSEQAAAIVPSKSLREHNVIRINGGKAGQVNKPQNVAQEPDGEEGKRSASDTLKTADLDPATAPVPHITTRPPNTAKLVQPKQQQQPKQTKHRPDPKGNVKRTSPVPPAPTTSVPLQNAQAKKVKSPIPSPTLAEKATVTTTPTRTKTPRKQQLIPTKLDSDDTFIPPTSPRVHQQPAQKSPKPPVRNRYAASRLPSPVKRKSAALTEQLKSAKVQRVQQDDTKPAEVRAPEPEEQTVDGTQQENAPVNVVPIATATSSPKVLKPATNVCQQAIYAVLEQIHGK